MSAAAKSVYYFGIYLALLGLVLLIAPNLLLGIVMLPATNEVWVRVGGMLLLALSVYYIVFGKNDNALFFKLTVYIRSTIIIFFSVFALAGFVKPVIILFAVVDLLGALYTYSLLKKEGRW